MEMLCERKRPDHMVSFECLACLQHRRNVFETRIKKKNKKKRALAGTSSHVSELKLRLKVQAALQAERIATNRLQFKKKKRISPFTI